MSLQTLTRNCFQSGLPPRKWLNACKLFLKNNELMGENQVTLSNSVLCLYPSYPGDPDLTEYLKQAIQDQMIDLPVFVSTFLKAARSPDFRNAATLDTLCRVALDAHYLNGIPPLGSVIDFNVSINDHLDILTDALNLVAIAHSLPLTHFHQLTRSAEELATLVLVCVGDVKQLTASTARSQVMNAHDLVIHCADALTNEFKTLLDQWIFNLHGMLNDNEKAMEELMHSAQAATGKGDMLGQSSEMDIVSLSLLLQRMVRLRGLDRFGAGSGMDPVALLAAMYRWTSWSPTVFYRQLLHACISCMAEESGKSILVWKAFFVGRLPVILTSFEKEVSAEGVAIDWKSAMHAAAVYLKQLASVTSCDVHLAGHDLPNDSSPTAIPSSILRDFVQEAAVNGLLDKSTALSIDHHLTNEPSTPLRVEVRDSGGDVEAYMTAKLENIDLADLELWSARLWRDPGLHRAFADALAKRFATATSSQSPEADQLDLISRLCEICSSQDALLDIFALHRRVSDLVAQTVLFVDDYDVETVGDPQTAYGHLGKVILFIQETIARFHLGTGPWTIGTRTVNADFLRTVSTVYPLDKLSEADRKAYDAWLQPMFRGGDEGIDDQILRATPPKTLLRITPTLFYIAMQMHSTSELTIDALDNGISYFVGPLLNWTLVGVMQTILRELMGKINMLKTHLHVVSSIILKDTCPRAILRMCGPGLLSMTSFLARSSSLPNQPPIYTHYRLADLQHKVVQASNGRLPAAKIIPSQKPLQPMEALHRALKRAGEGKAPVLDIERCLIATSPLAFLEVLWDALNHLEAHISSVSEGSRRIAVFVLASPPCPGTPPLLPIFLHSFVPPLLSRIDHVQVPAEHIILVELLSVILSSALTAAMHVEWAFQTVSKGAHPIVLGQSSSAMARSLAAELRRHKNSASRAAVLKRLCASQAFRTNFPMMVGD